MEFLRPPPSGSGNYSIWIYHSGNLSSHRGHQGRRGFILPPGQRISHILYEWYIQEMIHSGNDTFRKWYIQGISPPIRKGNFSFMEFIIQGISHSGNFSCRQFLIPSMNFSFREFLIQEISHPGNYLIWIFPPAGSGNFSHPLWISPTLYEFLIPGIYPPLRAGNLSSPPGREFFIQGIYPPIRAGNFSFREFILPLYEFLI